jgi:DNA-binding CsgD family transcriptional regulator
MVLKKDENGGIERHEEERKPDDEPDLPPEYCRYRDEGCEYAGSYLRCPFPQCLFDEPRGRQRWMKGLRDREINRLFNGGRNVKELALMFGVSQRTIQRALKEARALVHRNQAATAVSERRE